VGATAAAAPAAAHTLRSPVGVNRLRPPGAVDERSFTGRCIRCGRCAEVCPYRAIIPLDARDGVNAGTPLIRAEEVPCYLCMECVAVCPTGALQRIELAETRMGTAVIDHHTCVAWTEETLCRTCYSVCPLRDSAIHLTEFKPHVDPDRCAGCGICAHACPVDLGGGRRPVVIDPAYEPRGDEGGAP